MLVGGFVPTGLVGKEIEVDRRLMQRGVADIVEHLTAEAFHQQLHHVHQCEVFPASSKRSIEDVKVVSGSNTYFVDIKTRDVNCEFSMPNLISIARLKKVYDYSSNFIVYVFVDYEVIDDRVRILSVRTSLIEELPLDCLHVQNLGKGQLQIRDAKKALPFQVANRSVWMKDLSRMVRAFYEKQIVKIQGEMEIWNNA